MNNNESNQLIKILKNNQVTTIPHSPIHDLKHLGNNDQRCYIKRDDMMGGLCNGSKQRKFLSILPYLLQKKFTEAVVIGSAYSNNVTAIVPLLIQNNIKPTLFLRGEPDARLTGNFLHTRIFVPECNIHWINREQWPCVMEQAQDYVQSVLDKNIAIIPEGACMPQALWGSLTLAMDIIVNEQQLSTTFDHIFIEAGTGGTAAALIIGLAFLKHYINIHVLLLADDEKEFHTTLIMFQHYFQNQCHVDIDLGIMMKGVFFHTPFIYKSFGAVGSHIFCEIIDQARTNGVLLDPIYAAKLIMTGKAIMQQCDLSGNILFMHNGGTLSLMGFQEQIQKALLTSQCY